MKLLPVLLFAAFCVAAHAEEEEKDIAASFLRPGKTYFFEFLEGAKIERGDYTIVSATHLTNWYVVDRGNGIPFFLNINTASQMYERNRREPIVIKQRSEPTGTQTGK
jgi:hypothetical protein